MNHQQYQENCLKTASNPDQSAMYNGSLLWQTIRLASLVGALMDLVKKQIFYGSKKVKEEDIDAKVAEIAGSLRGLQLVRNSPVERRQIGADLQILHSIVGCVGEAGEMAEAALKLLAGQDIKTNLEEEFGDNMYYLAIGMKYLGVTQEQVFDSNMAKLSTRYPEGYFSLDRAENRDLDAEKAALERS